MPVSSKAPLIILVAGTLAVVGLVGWAMMRSIDAPMSSGMTTTTEPPAPVSPASSALSTTEPHSSDAAHAAVPRISADELKAKMDKNLVTVIDVRDAESFQRGHIPGALHIPMARIEGEIDYLPKTKEIVTYCT